MEVKKDTNPKITAKRKQSAEPKVVPKPEPTPTIDPARLPKVKSETDFKAMSQFDAIKRKREEMFNREKEKQKQIKNNAIQARKNKRIFQIVLTVTLFVLFVFAPIYPNNEFVVNNRYYTRMSDIQVNHPLGNYISPFQFLRYESELNSGNEYIKSIDLKYNLRAMTVTADVEEYIPLAKDVENNVYFYENDEVVKKSGIDLYAPVISGFNQSNLEKLLKNLNPLDYNVIQSIDTIEYVGTEDDPDLLKLSMEGEHTVYIDMTQMKSKLPYYNQIKQIIDDKADGQPGIIHLDVGDYYEPK